MERKRINRLKVVLAEKGMTNKQLSVILDRDPAVISKWVTNAAQPNVEMFIRWHRFLVLAWMTYCGLRKNRNYGYSKNTAIQVGI